jgi:hypothetical protein
MRGVKLAVIVNNIRTGRIDKNHEEELASIGFIYDKQPNTAGRIAWETLKIALDTFKNIKRDLTIASRFVIPDTTDPRDYRLARDH